MNKKLETIEDIIHLLSLVTKLEGEHSDEWRFKAYRVGENLRLDLIKK